MKFSSPSFLFTVYIATSLVLAVISAPLSETEGSLQVPRGDGDGDGPGHHRPCLVCLCCGD
ncbi:hypothetical protein E1B28_007768 [Marasmius oreades]|uniref:Hepcidin n=1 Tax=Marasmius oreades TaxID=181124 RepID=A0A9P7UVA7_9AGAR|nr:uncharacterized protein E1B28_007768 [Marasmius oreades]KAG7094156.1 hypothetical protein E1B28_007768 [Marasmius oreades]